jgi:tetratricopeptide (TPR) repeat protein
LQLFLSGNILQAEKVWSQTLRSINVILEKIKSKNTDSEIVEFTNIKLRTILNLSQASITLGNLNHAVQFADEALLIDPSNAKALYRRTYALVELGKLEEAKHTLESALRIHPDECSFKLLKLALHRAQEEESMRIQKLWSGKLIKRSSDHHVVGQSAFMCCKRRK